MRLVMMVAGLALLAGCGKPAEAPAGNAAAFVPPAVQAPDPLPGQAQSNPLSRYVGKYPSDALDGVGFFDRTEVANALIAAVPEEKLRRTIVSREATQTPIFARDGRIGAHGCQPHDCGDDNWTFLITDSGASGIACRHELGDGKNSRWYSGSAKPAIRPGDCPAS